MRKIAEMQIKFFQENIKDIKFDLKSRDEIPKLLIGLQYIYCTPKIRKKVFEILEKLVPATSYNTGRSGMDLWKILVLGSLRLNCNWDFDKVHEMSNNHITLRQMLGHSKDDLDYRYALQTIKDNLALLTPEILDEINQVVVEVGHGQIKYKDEELYCSCDSFVVETNVSYPTDVNLLFKAMRKAIKLTAKISMYKGLSLWRQYNHNILKIKHLMRKVQRIKHSTSKKEEKKAARKELIVNAHSNFIKACEDLILRVKKTLTGLDDQGLLSASDRIRIVEIEEYMNHGYRQIDQTRRRVIFDEKIPHKEKVFSIFEPHTEWISKGKAGVSQELGLKVCILKDQYGFILHHQVMKQVTDEKIAIDMVCESKKRFPNMSSCSFDKGFYTPDNRDRLHELLNYVVLPKKGRLSAKDKEIQQSEFFVKYRKKHSSVESSINALENHGLDRCLDHGLEGFERYVSLSIVARNIQILGHTIQQNKARRQKFRKAA